MKKILEKNKKSFYQWFVGITDGDGSFSIFNQGGSWNVSFQISQSIKNIKLIYWIKKMIRSWIC